METAMDWGPAMALVVNLSGDGYGSGYGYVSGDGTGMGSGGFLNGEGENYFIEDIGSGDMSLGVDTGDGERWEGPYSYE